MPNEIDIFGIYVSPMLICIISAFLLRIFLSRVMQRIGIYKLISHKPIFDTAIFISLVGIIFNLFVGISAQKGGFLL
ncbi:DUF1656 domain-containing protein [Pseudoalteromonas sp. N1230-9]|uniref:DUF1656 domain-containing protein n=1 Tax=Pseudoalteromonas sp. N1230-9 TaxID=2907156 RepID=UPI004053B864